MVGQGLFRSCASLQRHDSCCLPTKESARDSCKAQEYVAAGTHFLNAVRPCAVDIPFRRTVRDAALDCLQELYRALGATLLDNLRRQSIRPAALREVAARLDQVRFGLIPSGVTCRVTHTIKVCHRSNSKV